jgi:hypothetical protein
MKGELKMSSQKIHGNVRGGARLMVEGVALILIVFFLWLILGPQYAIFMHYGSEWLRHNTTWQFIFLIMITTPLVFWGVVRIYLGFTKMISN